MGRHSTGALTNESIKRIDINYLMKNGFIKSNEIISGRLTWTDGGNINFESEFTDYKQYLRLTYCITNNNNGEKIHMDYVIQLRAIPSNLGRGEVWYFLCPISGRYARILYLAYGSEYFKCRKAYRNRIYYKSQICSKSFIDSEKYFILKDKLEKLYPRLKKTNYQGKETRLNKRIRNLEYKMEYYDSLRWISFEKLLDKYPMKRH
jgi:hypothetical protein